MSYSTLARRIRGRFGSVRVRITVVSTLVVAVVLVTASFALIELQRRSLTDNIDTTIRARADDIATLLEGGTQPQHITVTNDETALIQVVDGGGTVIAASQNIDGLAPLVDRSPPQGETTLINVSNLPIGDETYRTFSLTLSTSDGPLTILVASSLESVGDSIESLFNILRVGVPLLIVVVAAGTWFGVGRALSPVEDIRREVATITDQELSRRVPEPPGDHEIGRLARTMNEMLARLQDAHDRQERFVADASHELRSPLASMRTQIEVDVAHPDPERWEATTESLQKEVVRMQHLIDDLLLLAQSDANAMTLRDSLVDLDDIVLEESRRPQSRADLTIDTTAVSAGQVRGDHRQLARAFQNLLDNALRHAQSRVTVRLSEKAGCVLVVVDDDGPGIPDEAREHIFERFTRLDTGRGREQGGAGLGLAIVRAVAEMHGGSVEVDADYSGGARFVLSLPAV